ncbi:hypothetical protein BDV18DRAFT_142430 [Aspergillus unguis]
MVSSTMPSVPWLTSEILAKISSLAMMADLPSLPHSNLPSGTTNMASTPDIAIPPILSLPTELLMAIYQHLPKNKTHDTVLNFALVCHGFGSIALPNLYQTISIKSSETQKLQQLLPTLRAHSHLADQCLTLHLQAHDFSKQGIQMYTALLWALPRLRSFHLKMFDSVDVPVFWDNLATALQFLHGLEHVTISRDTSSDFADGRTSRLAQQDIVRSIAACAWLKSLSIDGVNSQDDPGKEFEMSLIPRMYHTAPFTSLSVKNSTQRPEEIEELINWPRHLSHFRFESYKNREVRSLDLPMLASWLAKSHQDTLQSLEVGYIYSPATSIQRPLLDTINFKKLGKVTLSIHQLCPPSRLGINDNLAHEYAQNDLKSLLSGPRLHTLSLDFSSQRGVLDDIASSHVSAQEVQCIRWLAQAATENKAALKKIEIRYIPSIDIGPSTGHLARNRAPNFPHPIPPNLPANVPLNHVPNFPATHHLNPPAVPPAIFAVSPNAIANNNPATHGIAPGNVHPFLIDDIVNADFDVGDTVDTCPWAALDLLKQEIEPRGIALVYNPPAVSRKKWTKMEDTVRRDYRRAHHQHLG